MPSQKARIVFQLSIFRGCVSFKEGKVFFLKLESPFLPWDNIKSWGQCALATCLKHLRHHLHSNSKHILYWKLTYPWLDVGRLRSFWFVRFSGDSLIFVCVCNNLMFMITHIYIYCLIHREGERERESLWCLFQEIWSGNTFTLEIRSSTQVLPILDLWNGQRGPFFSEKATRQRIPCMTWAIARCAQSLFCDAPPSSGKWRFKV